MPNHNALPPETVERLIEMREQGRAVREIAREVGCSHTTVQAYTKDIADQVRETGMSHRRRMALLATWR